VDRQLLNHWQPEIGVGPRGRLDFSGNLAGLRGGQTPNFYNQYAAFLLGLTSQAQKSYQWETMRTREWRFGFYFGDRWQHGNVTLDLGVRYEYFPLVTRANGRGVEVLDPGWALPGASTRRPLRASDTGSPTTPCRSRGRCEGSTR